MNKLHRLAKARYDGSSDETRKMVHNLFNEIDKDGDGEISVEEFMSFLQEDNDDLVTKHNFFHLLDKDENGSLNFGEALTIFYIFESGRPWCNSCVTFMPDEYFSCVECFDMGSPSFDICLDCYSTFKWDHIHNNPSHFLDNYTLLQRARDARNQDSYFKGEDEESKEESETEGDQELEKEELEYEEGKQGGEEELKE